MPKDADADAFVAELASATAEIEEKFFNLPVAYGDPGHTIYRERAYCYELYHRLRPRWTRGEYVLNGELSKAGHPYFAGLEKMPDLLVHVPGSMEGNVVIVEVKSARGAAIASDVRKDLLTLTRFVSSAQYERGVYLVYGDDGDPIDRVRNVARTWQAEDPQRSLEKVHLLYHRRPSEPAQDVGW